MATSSCSLVVRVRCGAANTPRRPARYRSARPVPAPSSPPLPGNASVRLAIRTPSYHRFVAQGEWALVAEWPLAATVRRCRGRGRGRGRRRLLLSRSGLALHERLLIRPALQPRIPAMARDGAGRLGRLAALVCIAARSVGFKVSHGAPRLLGRAAGRETVALHPLRGIPTHNRGRGVPASPQRIRCRSTRAASHGRWLIAACHQPSSSTIRRTGRLLAPSMPVSSSALPAIPPQLSWRMRLRLAELDAMRARCVTPQTMNKRRGWLIEGSKAQ
jgi:hypothetical protein